MNVSKALGSIAVPLVLGAAIGVIWLARQYVGSAKGRREAINAAAKPQGSERQTTGPTLDEAIRHIPKWSERDAQELSEAID